MKDPYTVLGVARGASQDEIKSAYRKLARSMHPDVNQNDPGAEDKFKDISGAYDLLSDPQKRARFDRGEIDAAGNEHRGFRPGTGPYGARGAYRGASGNDGRSGGFGRFDFESTFGEDDLFSEMFRRASRGQGGPGAGTAGAAGAGPRPVRGQDAQYRLKVTFEEAALGSTKRITLTNRKTLDVRIPPGSEDGRSLRLKGQGADGSNGGAAGDALVEIGVKEHAFFRRDGINVVVDVPVTLQEVVLGGKITVPTLEGKVSVTVPEGSNTGTVLRLRGKGIPQENGQRGDLLVRLGITLPDPEDPKLKTLVKKLKDPETDPREQAGMV
ncbi:molecular chaperone DnaJ [Rhodospirillum rubrum]|uniref:DnaJ C-terminal domain-containing protein n=1 Tax=Rhodospirillum rubrum TaxID=1085 RepID=UPI001908D86E|nr:J domain-containing protein [Rhodospirillum rubrum]MBK1665316.1 molecular chaperone DnaJ [Rhodospirillum rubrum]MBK1676504.1 molecular chaperone DnaJ [Rhodospirillum rubrum]